MSGAAKMRPTEVIIKEGKQITKFEFSPKDGRALLNFMRGLKRSAESLPAEKVFPNITDPAKRIGIIFRGIRFKHHLTQLEVAKRLGIDQADVSKIESGKRPIGKALAKKIEKEFGIEYQRLL